LSDPFIAEAATAAPPTTAAPAAKPAAAEAGERPLDIDGAEDPDGPRPRSGENWVTGRTESCGACEGVMELIGLGGLGDRSMTTGGGTGAGAGAVKGAGAGAKLLLSRTSPFSLLLARSL